MARLEEHRLGRMLSPWWKFAKFLKLRDMDGGLKRCKKVSGRFQILYALPS